ncbi:MAG: hypothetical protein EA353_11360 [Puniceicoccaceae bacterium]|nr:MAG: hypothetical protein EA353_11360 [Puniceicoccaceae bacterium]
MDPSNTGNARRGFTGSTLRSFIQKLTRSSTFTPRSSLTSFLTLTLTFTFTLLCSVSALHADTLQSKNPFLPPGYGESTQAPPPPPPQVNGPLSRELEFRGIAQLNGVYQYSLYHRPEQKGYWLREDETQGGIQIRGFDPGSKALTVSMKGRTERLTLMSPSDTPLPVATSTSVTGRQPGLPSNLETPAEDSGDDDRRRVVPRRRVTLPQN